MPKVTKLITISKLCKTGCLLAKGTTVDMARVQLEEARAAEWALCQASDARLKQLDAALASYDAVGLSLKEKT